MDTLNRVPFYIIPLCKGMLVIVMDKCVILVCKSPINILGMVERASHVGSNRLHLVSAWTYSQLLFELLEKKINKDIRPLHALYTTVDTGEGDKATAGLGSLPIV